METNTNGDISKCPVFAGEKPYTAAGSTANENWWSNQLSLKSLRQNSALSNPMGEGFDYAKEFESLDLEALIADIDALMTAIRTFVQLFDTTARYRFRHNYAHVRTLVIVFEQTKEVIIKRQIGKLSSYELTKSGPTLNYELVKCINVTNSVTDITKLRVFLLL